MKLTQTEQEKIAKKLTNLSEEKRLTLVELLRKEGINPLKLPIIPAIRKSKNVPLSWAQERLWFLNQLEGSSATYNIPAAVRISGNLNINALQQALSEILQRHEALRTSFQTLNGTPIQVIDLEATMKINTVDLQQLETIQQENSVIEQAQEEATTPFDLENAPLIRCSLLQLDTREYVLLLTMHHIVSDGWSIGVLIQELSSLYQAFIEGESSPLEQLPIQYGDFAVWQKQYLSGEVLSTQLDYWKQQLSGAPDLLQLPTDYPRPTVQTYQGRTQSFSINTDLTTKLQGLSQESGTTLFMTLYAAFITLLHRYSGESDILIGSPIANRNRSEIEGLIGFFVNTLVLRTSFEDNPSFKELLAQVRETTLKAYDHQDVPFETVVEALQPKRSLSHSPLFQVMFVLQNAPMGDVELPGVNLSQMELENTIAKFDLTLSITETDQGLVGEWEYNTDLFDSQTIERMVAHFQNLLEAIVENPSQNVGSFNLLSESERHQLLVEWNDTVTEYPKHKCIHQLFEEQVEKTPLSIAVVFEEQQLTYQQLNQRVNQLAHHLQSLGVKPEVMVGICVERSIEMVVGLLGILKAGGAYVPLDPNYPQERISYMLEDSDVGVLVTQNSLLESLPENNARVVCLDSDWGVIEQHSQSNLDVGVNSDNLAYVIYTSGSTGKPKGVMILHGGMANYLNWCTKTYNVAGGIGSAVNSSIGFDATITSLFSSLLVGGKVVLLPETEEIEALKAALSSDSVFSLIKITPAHLEILSHLLEFEQVNIQTQAFIIGGEALSEKVASFWQKYAPKTRLINEYGPTETVVGCCIYEVEEQSFPVRNIPIGRPIANTQTYILDSQLQPVPVGVPGELHIGGDGLARGYLNRRELTQEKFIQNPFNKLQRLYKTGDLARYLPNGNIEYLGRIDNQVKIRGFRIELGEIEAVLTTHPQVNQTVVIPTEDNIGNKRLVAYVVANSEIKTQKLRNYLKAQLPEYMLPSAFVTLESLPLTPNGKIDRKALQTTDVGIVERETVYKAPRTQSEQIVANIFAQVLNVENIGINDNFFEKGGHSLLATQIILSLSQTFQINLPVNCLFEEPTVTGLANSIDTIVQKGTYTKTIPNLNTEAVLDPKIQFNSPFEHIPEPKNIFLTGATGFLGTYLLYELLENTRADIYCLVRSSDIKSAHIKLKNKLESYLLWNDLFSSRIIPIVGDLSAKLLGLSTQEFNQLANQIDVIYHNGAWVNKIYNYLTLKPANVLGTEEILRLASEHHIKPLHFISTIAIFSSEANSEIELIRESDIPEYNDGLSSGYDQSKWVAEKLVMEARDRGLPVSIYRPGMVIGHSQTGVSNTNDLFCRAIKGSLQLGMVPIIDYQLDLIPVDFVSQAIYEISRQQESLGKVFHLTNPNPTRIKNLFQWIVSLDYPLKEVSLSKWISELIARPENVMHPYSFNFKSQLKQEKELLQNYRKIDCQNTLKSLANTDIDIPTINMELLETYFLYFVRSGFFQFP